MKTREIIERKKNNLKKDSPKKCAVDCLLYDVKKYIQNNKKKNAVEIHFIDIRNLMSAESFHSQ